jgi:cytochrome oxidase assembly protein ShyY1
MTPTVASLGVEQRAVPEESMRSLRFLLSPRWLLFHLVVLAGVVLMVNLSLWQWNRLSERRDFNELVEERRDEPTLPYDDLVAPGSPDDVAEQVEWRAAAASGVYDDELSVVVVNRSQDGRAGANLVTPLVLDDGRVLLVNRGFLPLEVIEQELPPAPDGRVQVAGRLRASEVRRRGQISTTQSVGAPSGTVEVARIDIGELERTVGGDLEPVWLSVAADGRGATLSRPPDDVALSAVAEPELSQGSHLSYAIQWLIFSVCVIVGWVFAVRRSIRSRTNDAPSVT